MFGTVGTFGLVLDTARSTPCATSLACTAPGWCHTFVAATGTWLCNRLWTFRGSGSGPAHRQWARFLAANPSASS